MFLKGLIRRTVNTLPQRRPLSRRRLANSGYRLSGEPLEARRMLSVTPYDDVEIEAPTSDKLSWPDLPSLAPVMGDGNDDGAVDGLDYVIWSTNYGSDNVVDGGASAGDFNQDGSVDGLDYVTWAQHFGTKPLTPYEAALVDFNGADMQGKDGPLSSVGVELARLYHEYRLHMAAGGSATDFSPSSSLMHTDNGKIVVDVVANGPPQASDGAWQNDGVPNSDTQQLIGQLERLGATVTGSYGRMVSALLPIMDIPAVAGVSGVQSVSASAMTSNVGLVDSQGDVAMRSDLARGDLEVDGTGITVGVLSDSYNSLGGAATDVANGDLPANVTVLSDTMGSDEGRAMMQLIADVAPGADQAFHTAFMGQAGFAQGIVDLANVAGADVIVDDVIYFAEPMFQDGVIAQAIDSVVDNGVAYFSSAGNGARDSYESPFGASGNDLILDGTDLGELHDFDPGAGTDNYQAITVAPGGGFLMSFQWADPFASVSGVGASTDLDIYVFDTDTPTSIADVLTAGIDSNIGGDPIELISYVNPDPVSRTVYLGIANYAGPNPDLLKYVQFGGGVSVDEYDTASGTAYGHTNAAGTSSVGASYYVQTPEFGVDPAVLEPYSSAGDIPILFDTAGNRLQVAEQRQTPDIVGPDGANTTFFGFDVEPDGFPNFFGTSAAAPHVAAVAALMLNAAGGEGSLSPQDTYNVLESTARDMDDPATPGFDVGYDSGTGWGFVDAQAAVESVAIAQPQVREFPVPLDSIDPEGSLIYSGEKQSTIGSPDDTDGYTISVDPGQTITVVVDGNASLQPAVNLYRLTGEGDSRVHEASAVAAAAGGTALLQSIPTRGQIAGNGPGPETYLIEVAGAEGTTGRYTLDVILNSAVEDESHGGASNNTLADAQDLDPSFVPLHNAIGNGPDGASPQPGRGAVLGTLDATPGSVITEVEPNDPTAIDLLAVAQNIDGAGWNVNASADIPFNGTVPHVSIQGSGDGSFDYYSFTADAGRTARFDIDYENFDTELFLYDDSGNLLAANDDSGGDPGSNSGFASFIYYTFANAGQYVIGVGEYDSYNGGGYIDGNPPDPGDTYTLHVVLQDHALNPGGVDPLPEVEPNQPGAANLLTVAQDISGADFSLSADSTITNSTSIPHVTIEGTGDGSFDYYSFEVDAAGSRGIFDIDFENFDSELFLYDANGNLLAANDDNGGDPGSGGVLASYIDYTFPAAGSYVIGVGEFNSTSSGGLIVGNPPDDGDVYTLNVSLQGHDVVEGPPDWYQFDLLAGQSTTIAATSLTGGDVNVELYDADGNLLAADIPSGNLIQNGSFETGDFSGWSTTTTGPYFRPWNVSSAGVGGGFGLDATSPQDGNFVAWNGFDGGGPMSFTMYQDVDIPSDVAAATLQWQDRIQWIFDGYGSFASEPRTYDVQVRDPGTDALLETLFSFSTGTQDVNPSGDTGWQSRSANLSSYAGSSVRIQFEEYIPQSSTGPAQIEFDAISLIVGDAAPPTNVDSVIHYVAPETGTYFVRVSGDGATDYSLLLGRDADFSLEDNNDIDSARDIFAGQTAGRQWVYGSVESSDPGEGLITFDELPTQPVDGLTIEGVTFDFKVGGIDSTDALFNAVGPGTTTYLAPPLLEGNAAGVLTMDFDSPVHSLSFGAALSTFGDVPVGFEVELFDADNVSLGVFPVTTESLVSFTEGLFEYEGADVSRAVVDFNETVAGRFALDNVEFATTPPASSDFYRVELTHGAPLEVETFTPAHQSGEFVNELDPLLRLYDAAGNLVASNDNGASDGRNALLRYKAPHGEEGTYYIEVTSAQTEPATSGDYILAVKGAVLPNDGFNDRVDIADGNGDGLVNGADFLVWASGFSEAATVQPLLGPADGDFNHDGAVDGLDYLVWSIQYNEQSLTSSASSRESTATLSAVDAVLENEFDLVADVVDDASVADWQLSSAFDSALMRKEAKGKLT